MHRNVTHNMQNWRSKHLPHEGRKKEKSQKHNVYNYSNGNYTIQVLWCGRHLLLSGPLFILYLQTYPVITQDDYPPYFSIGSMGSVMHLAFFTLPFSPFYFFKDFKMLLHMIFMTILCFSFLLFLFFFLTNLSSHSYIHLFLSPLFFSDLRTNTEHYWIHGTFYDTRQLLV